MKTCGEHHQIQHDIDRDRRHAGDHCAWGHLIGNGICEKHIMYLEECQYDQLDCDLNVLKFTFCINHDHFEPYRCLTQSFASQPAIYFPISYIKQ